MFLFSSEMRSEIAPAVSIRVFDICRGGRQHEVTAHIFRNCTDVANGEFLGSVAFRLHTSWAKHCADTPATKWKDWRKERERVIDYKARGWRAYSEQDDVTTELLSVYPRTTCKTRAKVPSNPRLYRAAEVGAAHTTFGSDNLPLVDPNRRNGVLGQEVSGGKSYPSVSLADTTGVVSEVTYDAHWRYGEMPPPSG